MKLSSFTAALLFLTFVSVLPGAADDSVIFSDDFATLDPGWGEAGDIKSVSGNKLIVNLQPELIHRSVYEGRAFDLDSADIRLKVTEVKGGTDQPAGIVFWAIDTNNYYAALIQSDGGFYVGRRVDGQWLAPVSLKTRSEVHKGLGQVNALRVVTSGKLVTVYVNDAQVVTFKGFPPQGESRIGVHAESGDAPCTWAFSELSVRKGSSTPDAKTAQDASVLFADDFSTLDPAWIDADETRSVSGNKLILKPPLNKSIGFLYSGCLFGDADIRVKIAEIQGGTDSPAGVIFWAADIDNLYAVFIYSNGGYFVGRKIDGQWNNPTALETRSELNKGLGQVNELRVVTVGESAIVYINDKQVVKIDGYKHPDQSQIGLQAESDDAAYTWAISDVVVRKPQ